MLFLFVVYTYFSANIHQSLNYFPECKRQSWPPLRRGLLLWRILRS
ncbi:unnamed protein product, partial [Vitis vinifera]